MNPDQDQVITRLQIVHQARLWLRTPYVHWGRLRGKETDCLFPLAICEELGIKDVHGVPITSEDYSDYVAKPKDGFIHEEAMRRLIHKNASELLPGDLVTLRRGGLLASHCGIIADFRSPHYSTLTLIHCTDECVVEYALGRWRCRIAGAFSFPGVH